MEKQERKRASLRSDGKTGEEVSTEELNAAMPTRPAHAAGYGCPQPTPCGRHGLERVVAIRWNAWSISVEYASCSRLLAKPLRGASDDPPARSSHDLSVSAFL